MKQRELTWKLIAASLLALAAILIFLPFAVAGFLWDCIVCAFQIGQGIASDTSDWIKEQ